MAKNNREKARELAQTFTGKVRRNDIKAAEDSGYTTRQIKQAVQRSGSVGSGVQPYIDKQAEKQAEERIANADPKRIQYANLPGTSGQRVYLNASGTGLATDGQLDYLRDVKNGLGSQYGGQYRVATDGSAERINNYLKENNFRLKPGKNPENWAIVDNKQITVQSQATALPWMASGGGSGANAGGGAPLEQGKEYVAIYGRVGGGKGNRQGSGGSGGRNRRGGQQDYTPRETRAGNRIVNRYQTAQDNLYGRGNDSGRPQLFSGGYTPGSGIASVANFANDLDAYNQRQLGYMNDIAEGSRYESGRILNSWVTGLPKAPDYDSTDELLATLTKAIDTIDFG